VAHERGGTPATTSLSRAGIPFTVHSYTHDPAAAEFGPEAAEKLQVDPERIFKTLVVAVDDRVLVVGVVPVAARLDAKKIAQAARGKHARLADPHIAERKTGYILGGISPVGQKTKLQTFVEETAQVFDTIFVSGGRRGMDIEIRPEDLLAATDGVFADIAR